MPKPSQKSLQDQVAFYELLFDGIYNGIMVTDPDGYIIHLNRPYGEFLGVVPRNVIGRHCTEVVENTRMHLVGKSGKAEINQVQQIRGRNIVVQRIPIFKDDRIVAVFGLVMFTDIREVGRLARKISVLESKVQLYEQELLSLRSTRYTLDSIVGVSPALERLKKEAARAASSLAPVLITGESGTGKELFAQAIHHGGPRKIYPFVRINCAAIPSELMETELFGYEKGAFTGARKEGKPGKFELSHRGTVFLDEIGDLPLAMQPKLLRVLEEKEFERVGGTRLLRPDFRLITATNQDLLSMMDHGRFRKDLFYRLNVIPLHIPPLRERKEDILPVTYRLLAQLTDEADMTPVSLSPQAEAVLANYAWPGNVRELANVLERTLAGFKGGTIRKTDLPFYLLQGKQPATGEAAASILRSIQKKGEQEAIRDALRQAGYNKARAARILGIHRTHLYRKLRQYGLEE